MVTEHVECEKPGGKRGDCEKKSNIKKGFSPCSLLSKKQVVVVVLDRQNKCEHYCDKQYILLSLSLSCNHADEDPTRSHHLGRNDMEWCVLARVHQKFGCCCPCHDKSENAKPHLLVVPHCCSIFLSLHIIAESILDRLDSHRVFVDEYHYEDASSSRLQRRQRRQHNKHPRSHHQRSKSSGDALTMAAALEALSSDDDDGQRSIESWSLPTLGTLLPTPLPAYLQGVILLSVVLPPISNYVVRTYVQTNKYER